MIGDVFFDGWTALLRIALTVPAVYVGIVLMIRISGKRSTSQMNNFDWIVTVAMGSLIASTTLNADVSVAEGLFAVLSFLCLQYLVTRFTPVNDMLRRAVKPPPRLLFYDGQFLWEDMWRERVSELEIRAAIRGAGHHDISGVASVVLETDAKLTVLAKGPHGELPVLSDVVTAGAPERSAARRRR